MGCGVLLLAALMVGDGQSLSDVRRSYDAGKFKETVATGEQARTQPDVAPRIEYVVAQSHEKLNNVGGARDIYQRLAGGGDPGWSEIGRSALAVLDNNYDEALQAATNAVNRAASLPEAQYQRGLVLTHRRDYEAAADAFDKATQLDPSFAAAHYYAGLNYSRIKRPDRMASHFEAFLKLAPNAPERPEVESIMRTMRGR